MPPHLAPDGPTDGGGDNRTPWPSSGGGIGSRGVRGGDAAARHPLVSLVVDAVGVLAVVLTSFVAHQVRGCGGLRWLTRRLGGGNFPRT